MQSALWERMDVKGELGGGWLVGGEREGLRRLGLGWMWAQPTPEVEKVIKKGSVGVDGREWARKNREKVQKIISNSRRWRAVNTIKKRIR